MVDLSHARGFELTVEAHVERHYLDAMNHMNVMWYGHLFDRGVWAYFARHGLGDDYFEREGRGMFALEQTTRYLAELRVGEPIWVHTGLVEVRDKTLRLAHLMLGGAERKLAATAEVVAGHVDRGTRRIVPFPAELAGTLREQAVATPPGASMTEASAQKFARDWVAAWNRRDAEAVLAHYADDAVFHSPKAERIVGHGRVEGKENLRAYWQAAQSRVQKLAFALEAAHYSPRSDTLTVVYQATFDDQAPTRTTEVMQFSGSRIVRGEAFYGATALKLETS